MKGWLAACATVTAAIYGLVLLFLVSEASPPALVAGGVNLLVSLIFVPVVLTIVCLLTAIPAAMVVWIGEVSRTRSALFFGAAGGAIGVLSQTILLRSLALPFVAFFAGAGFVAGLTYWQVAVRPVGVPPG
jgi:hypothetical protein